MKPLVLFFLFALSTSTAYCQAGKYFIPLTNQNDTVGFKDTRGGDFVIIKVWEDASDEIFNGIVAENKRIKVQRASEAEKIQVEFLWEKDAEKNSMAEKNPITLKQGSGRHLINAGNSMRAGLLINILGTAGGTVLVYTGQPVLGSLVITASGLIYTVIQFYTAAELTNAGLELKE